MKTIMNIVSVAFDVFIVALVSGLILASKAQGADMSANGEAIDTAVMMLKRFEGFRPIVYQDTDNQKAIGYGFSSASALGKKVYTETEATRELTKICKSISAQLKAELKGQNLEDHEQAALISFVYNVGWGNFKNSTMCRLLKEGKRGSIIGKEFTRWVYVTKEGKKQYSNGLMNRREKERRVFVG